LRAVLRRRAGLADAQGRGAGAAGGEDHAGGVQAAAAVLRERTGGVYLPGRAVTGGGTLMTTADALSPTVIDPLDVETPDGHELIDGQLVEKTAGKDAS